MVSRLRSLRAVSVLCWALILYGLVPHVHVDAADERIPHATAQLSSDDAHESHSTTLDVESHPCALCRHKVGFDIPLASAALLGLDLPGREIATPGPAAFRAELLIAEQHPARAPPLA